MQEYIQANDLDIDLMDTLHSFHTLTGMFEQDLQACYERVVGWLPEVNAMQRTEQPLAHLRVALQVCILI